MKSLYGRQSIIITAIVAATILITSITYVEASSSYVVDPALIATVQGYEKEIQYGSEHVERWTRVLAAFGVANHDNPITAAEAQEMADKFSANRWNPIVAELTALEASQQTQDDTPQETDPNDAAPQDPNQQQQITADPALIKIVQGYEAETQYGTEHVERWTRVLAAFGVADHADPMTSAEAQEMANKFSASRWNPIAQELQKLEAWAPAVPDDLKPQKLDKATREIIKGIAMQVYSYADRANALLAESDEYADTPGISEKRAKITVIVEGSPTNEDDHGWVEYMEWMIQIGAGKEQAEWWLGVVEREFNNNVKSLLADIDKKIIDLNNPVRICKDNPNTEMHLV